MGRPRTKPLPRGIRARKLRDGSEVYWISFQWNGRQVQEHAGTDRAAAERLRAQRLREVEAATYRPENKGAPLTLATWSERWLAIQRAEGVRTVSDLASIMRDHVLPAFGDRRLDEIRPADVRSWVLAMRDAGTLAPKTIRNVHGALNACLSRAVFEELIDRNVAAGLPRGTLPSATAKVKRLAWTREEIVTMLTDPRTPEAHRVAWAVAALTGARVGEVAGLRWRDLDTDAAPLWGWMLRTQYDGQPLKTDNPRDVPIHPDLRRVLERWRAEGWTQWTARGEPGPGDFVVPREDGTVHSKQSLGGKAVRRYAGKLGIETRGTLKDGRAWVKDFHSFRRSFVTHALADGADRDSIGRVTHNAAGEILDGYNVAEWATVCRAVEALQIALSHDFSMTRQDEAHETAMISGASIGGAGSRKMGRTDLFRSVSRGLDRILPMISGRTRRRARSSW